MLRTSQLQDKVLEDALKTFGKEQQIRVVIEELTELSLELQHGLKRGFNDVNVRKETADVFICLQYLTKLFGEPAIQQDVSRKIERLKKRLAQRMSSVYTFESKLNNK